MNGLNRLSKYALVGALCVLAASALAQPMPPAGTWGGAVKADSGGRRVYLDLTFAGRGATLHFEEPYNCRIKARFVDADGNTRHFRFKPSTNGGHFCDGLYPGEFTAKQPSDAEIDVSFKNGANAWTGRLKAENPSR